MINSRHVVVAALTSVIQIVVAAIGLFVLYKFLLDSIGPADLGVWSIVVATSSLVQMANFGLAGSVTKQVGEFDAINDEESIAKSIETSAISMGVFSLIIIAVTYPIATLYLRFAVDGFRLELASEILPAAMLAFWVMMVGSIYQGALFGCHMVVARNLILIGETVVYVVISVWVTPKAGLVGLVWARLLQNLLTLAISIVVLRARIPALHVIPGRWDPKLFRAAFSYAASFQLISLLVFACDPLTKGLLSRFGTVSMVGYYEMANRLVLQFRSLLVSSSQVLVPVFIRVNRLQPGRIAEVFEVSYQVLFFLSVGIFGFVIAGIPFISLIWLGKIEPQFVEPAILLALGWCVNSIGLPAYHSGAGTGQLRPNVVSHILMAVSNLVLAFALGSLLEAKAVVWGWAIALAAGGICTTWLYLPKERRVLAALCPIHGARLIIGMLIGTVGAYLLFFGTQEAILTHESHRLFALADNPLILGMVSVLVYLSAMLVATAGHPVKRQLVGALTSTFSRKAPN